MSRRRRRRPSPRGDGRRHSTHHERDEKPKFTERVKEEIDELGRKAKDKWLIVKVFTLAYTGLEWKPGDPLPQHLARYLERRLEHNRRHSDRGRSPDAKGFRQRKDVARRERRDTSYHRWPNQFSSSTPGPTKPKSPHSQASPCARRRTRSFEDDYLYDTRAYGYSVSPTSIDTFDIESDNESLYDTRARGHSVTSIDTFDIESDDDCHDPPADATSYSDGANENDLNKTLSVIYPDRREDLDVAIPSDSKQLTTSLCTPRLPLQEVPVTRLEHTSTDPNGDSANNRQDAPFSLPVTLDTDSRDTTTGSNKDHAGGHDHASPFAHGTSGSDAGEGSDLRLCPSDSGGHQEENVRQVVARPLQVADENRGTTHPDSGKSRDAPLTSNPLGPTEDHQVQNVRNAAIHLRQLALVDHSGKCQDEGPATDLNDTSIDAPSEDKGEVDDSLGRDEEHASIPPTTDPDDLERSLPIAPAVPSSLAEPSLRFPPGSIVRLLQGSDHKHPYVITRTVRDDNGKLAVMACCCTSRPQFWRFEQQYGTQQKKWRKHFFYIGGIEEGDFYTGRIDRPTVAELDFQGRPPPMPKQTYIELFEKGPYNPNALKWYDVQRQLNPESLDKLLNQLHGCKKIPTGSVPVAQPEIFM